MRIRMIAMVCVLVSAVLALTGCGGGGGTSLMVGDEPANQERINDLISDLNMAQDDRDKAQEDLRAAEATLMAIQGDAVSPEAAVQALRNQIGTLEGRLTSIQNEVTDATDAEAAVASLKSNITRLEQRLSAIAGMVDGADTAETAVSMLQADLKKYRDMVKDMEPPTANPRASAVKNALDSTGRRPGPTANLTLTQIMDAEKATGVATDEKFTKSSTMPPEVMYGGDDNDFIGATYTRTMDNITDEVTIYTDKQESQSDTFEEYYGEPNESNSAAELDGISAVVTTISDPTAPTDAEASAYGTISFDQDVSKIRERFNATMFPRGANQARRYEIPQGDQAVSFSGRFHGIRGTYKCTSTCSAQNDGNGQLTLLTGEWMFDPTPTFRADNADGTPNGLAAVMVAGVRDDEDYLRFGYWVRTIPQTRNRDDRYEIGMFADGQNPYGTNTTVVTSAGVQAMEGTAKYTGAAAGMFVKETLDADGTATPINSGQFTANAELTASFGGNSIAMDDHFTVSGMISNFRDADGDLIDSNWKVTLGRSTSFVDTANSEISSNDLTGKTMVGLQEAGDWSGMLFGDPMLTTAPAEPATDATPAQERAYTNQLAPTGVAGEFDADFINGGVIGAFGATRP